VLSDGTVVPGKQSLNGGPSVLFDAVALLVSDNGAARLANDGAARDFVADAFGHCKFIAFTAAAQPLLEKAGVRAELDEGCVALDKAKDAAGFIETCGQLRYWRRELKADLAALA
jgi:catalase